jgi:hypothetical protein
MSCKHKQTRSGVQPGKAANNNTSILLSCKHKQTREAFLTELERREFDSHKGQCVFFAGKAVTVAKTVVEKGGCPVDQRQCFVERL